MRLSLFKYYLPPRAMMETALIAVGVTGLNFGVLAWGLPRNGLAPHLLTLSMFFGSSVAWLQCWRVVARNGGLSELEAVLPVATRELALTRILAMAVFWLIPVWASLAAVVTICVAKGAGQFAAPALSMALSVSGLVLLATVIRYRALPTELAKFPALAISGLTFALMFAGFLLPFVSVGAIGCVLAILVGWADTHMVPDASQLPIGSTLRPSQTDASKVHTYTLDRLLLKRCLLSWRPMLAIVLLVAFPLVPSIGVTDWFIPLWIVWISAMGTSQTLGVLAHLPISRQRLFAYLVVPPMVALLVGQSIGYFSPNTLGYFTSDGVTRIGSLVDFDRERSAQGERVYDLYVPANWWRITTGELPLVTAPNGDAHRPTAHSIGPFTVYNPYEAGYKRGTEFLSYQLSRALRHCCDLDLTPRQVQSRYLSSEYWHQGLYQRDYPELQETRSPISFALRALGLILLSLAGLSTIFYRNRPAARKSQWLRQQVNRWAALVIVGGSAFLLSIFAMSGSYPVRPDSQVFGPGLMGPVWNLTVQSLANNVAIAMAAGLVGVAAIVVSYCALQWRFQHMELRPQPDKATIPDRSLVEV